MRDDLRLLRGTANSLLQNAAKRSFSDITSVTLPTVLEELPGKRYVGANQYRKAGLVLERMKDEWGMSDELCAEGLDPLAPSERDKEWATRLKPTLAKKDPVARESHPLLTQRLRPPTSTSSRHFFILQRALRVVIEMTGSHPKLKLPSVTEPLDMVNLPCRRRVVMSFA